MGPAAGAPRDPATFTVDSVVLTQLKLLLSRDGYGFSSKSRDQSSAGAATTHTSTPAPERSASVAGRFAPCPPKVRHRARTALDASALALAEAVVAARRAAWLTNSCACPSLALMPLARPVLALCSLAARGNTAGSLGRTANLAETLGHKSVLDKQRCAARRGAGCVLFVRESRMQHTARAHAPAAALQGGN